MNTTGFSVALSALPLVFSLAVRAAEAAGAPPGNGAATKLDTNHRIGDRYSYRTLDLFSKVEDRQYTMRVTAITDGRVIFGNGARIADLLGNDIQLGNGMQITGQQIYVAEYGVGKTWATKYRFRRQDGAEFNVAYEFKVVAKEQITVPAGTFDTYRIEGGGYINQESGHGGPCRGRHSIYKIWIAPDQVRRFIAQDYINEGAALGCGRSVAIRTELMAYQPGRLPGSAKVPATSTVQEPAKIPETAKVPETTVSADYVPAGETTEEPSNESSRD